MELSPERSLLLACARTNLLAEERRRISELASADLDWDQITAVAYAHGVAPLIYHSLAQSGVICLAPPNIAQTLEKAYYGNAARNLLLYSELRKVLLSLRQEKVEAIVLKGAALAETVYPHRALRPMSDIDLLVGKNNVAKAEAALMEIGYRVDASTKERRLREHYHLVFEKPGCSMIELHWHIKRPSGPFKMDIDTLWQRSRPLKVAGIDALSFSPEDLLLHLCQHFWKHEFAGGIRPLCDIAEVTKHYGNKIDWTKAVARSSEWEMNACTYVGLRLARDLLDAAIPERHLEDLRPVNFKVEVISWATESVLGHGECPLVFPDLLKLFWKGHSVKERWRVIQRLFCQSRVSGCANDTSVPNRDYTYYPSRIKHLLMRYAPTVGRLWVGNQKIRAAAETEGKQQRLAKWLAQGSNVG